MYTTLRTIKTYFKKKSKSLDLLYIDDLESWDSCHPVTAFTFIFLARKLGCLDKIQASLDNKENYLRKQKEEKNTNQYINNVPTVCILLNNILNNEWSFIPIPLAHHPQLCVMRRDHAAHGPGISRGWRTYRRIWESCGNASDPLEISCRPSLDAPYPTSNIKQKIYIRKHDKMKKRKLRRSEKSHKPTFLCIDFETDTK